MSKNTRILVHIGLEKTGTSSIQRFLTQNGKKLLKHLGILYPRLGPLFHNDNHSPIAAALVDPADCEFLLDRAPPDIDQVATALKQTIADSPRQLVLSSEHFSSRLDPEGVSRLAEMLGPYPIHILVYIRRQDQMALSAFSTQVRGGRRTWLNEREIVPDDPYFDYARLIDPWADRFGKSRIQVRICDPKHLHQGDLISDFLAVLGIQDSGDFKRPLPQNPSLNLAEAELVRLINQRLPTWEEAFGQGRPNDYHQAQHLRTHLLDRTAGIPAIQEAPPLSRLFSAQERQRILERFSDSNRRIARDYLDSDSLFAPYPEQDTRPGAPDIQGPERLTETQLAETLLALTRHIDQLQQPSFTTRVLRKTRVLIGRLVSLAKLT